MKSLHHNENENGFIMMNEIDIETLHPGPKVARLRAAANLTIEELSARADISVGALSQLERGKGNPGFTTLAKLAYALEVPIGTFFEGPPQPDPVVRRNARKKLMHNAWSPGTPAPVYELLTPDLKRKLEVIWVELPPGQSNQERPFIHDTEECGVLISGRVEVFLGNDSYILEPGDSISFNGTIPHWYRNAGEEPAISIWIVTPPSF